MSARMFAASLMASISAWYTVQKSGSRLDYRDVQCKLQPLLVGVTCCRRYIRYSQVGSGSCSCPRSCVKREMKGGSHGTAIINFLAISVSSAIQCQ